MNFFTLAIYVIGLILAGVGVFFLYRAFQNWRAASRDTVEAEQAFFEEAEREIATLEAQSGAGARPPAAAQGPPQGPPGAQGQPADCPAPPDSTKPAPPEAPAGGAETNPPLAPEMETFLQNLKRLGILDAREGALALPPPASPAPIFRLRGGGLALALDHLESEKFLGFQAQRFQMIFVRDAGGRSLVIRRYEDYLADHLAGPEHWGA